MPEERLHLPAPPGVDPEAWAGPPLVLIRSPRRRRTVAGRMNGEVLEIRVPAGLPEREESAAVADIARRALRAPAADGGDGELTRRARELNERHLGGRARVGRVRWVSNQRMRWASCSPAEGDIRVSDRLRSVPGYVLDAVLIHELVHTFVPGGHGPEFRRWAQRAPRAERAAGYLEAYQRHGR